MAIFGPMVVPFMFLVLTLSSAGATDCSGAVDVEDIQDDACPALHLIQKSVKKHTYHREQAASKAQPTVELHQHQHQQQQATAPKAPAAVVQHHAAHTRYPADFHEQHEREALLQKNATVAAGNESVADAMPGADVPALLWAPVRPHPTVLSNCLVLIPAFLGLAWGLYERMTLKAIPMDQGGKTTAHLEEIAGYIADGSHAFLMQEYKYLACFVVIMLAVIGPLISVRSMFAFLIGSSTSCLCGYIGMNMAVFCNVKTTYLAWQSGIQAAFDVSVRGGSIMGFVLVSLGVITLYATMAVFSFVGAYEENGVNIWEALCGYGLGGSCIALFARVGGGIYTKAADVGADLSGKNAYGLNEDDPRNPACIADNVGDNVGDIAGMGADLFGSFAESTVAGMVIAGSSANMVGGLGTTWDAMCFPLIISSTGILVGLVTLFSVRMFAPVKAVADIETSLKLILFISSALETPVVFLIAKVLLPAEFVLTGVVGTVEWWHPCVPVVTGLWAGLIVGFVTEYYTSHTYRPVREIAESQMTSAATGIIFGLALGYLSTVIPVLCLGVTIVVSFRTCGFYGISLAALGMLSTLTMGLTIDGFGPISDNAGGLAEMAELPAEVRATTDALDAAGNTTAAVGKGFAIGSAALVSLALFGAFCTSADIVTVNLLDSWTFLGLLNGAMLPYFFSALTMKSVGKAANAMVEECFRQFPLILEQNQKPEYDKCIEISTVASLREMIAPGALVILSPIFAGCVFGKECVTGLLCGALVSGVMMATSMANSGGAWDNSKKYVKGGGLGKEHKTNDTHKAAVTGDTVGDPMKDTSGPSLNILIKLSAITSLIFAPVICKMTAVGGGPLWLPAQ